MSQWIKGRVVGKTQWTATLFSLQFEAEGFSPFVAGQFIRVGLPSAEASPKPGEEIVGRPYSLVNAPQDAPLEIFCIEVAQGPLSPKLKALSVGDAIYAMPRANGFFSISEIPAAQVLWCFATGTGLGPFLSMLRTDAPWMQFKKIVLVHGARTVSELVYGDAIGQISNARADTFTCITLASRESAPQGVPHANAHLHGRITDALAAGTLECAANATLNTESHAMLCGNPQMVADMIAMMGARGMRKHRRREPGHFTTEAYW